MENIITKIPSGVNETQDNIALLRTSEDISMGEMAMPCLLPVSDIPPDDEMAVVVVGWGPESVS